MQQEVLAASAGGEKSDRVRVHLSSSGLIYFETQPPPHPSTFAIILSGLFFFGAFKLSCRVGVHVNPPSRCRDEQGRTKGNSAVVNVISDTRLSGLNVQHVVCFKLLLLWVFTAVHLTQPLAAGEQVWQK